MVCAPVRSIIPSLKLGDYLSVQAHKPCSISHLILSNPKVLLHCRDVGILVHPKTKRLIVIEVKKKDKGKNRKN